MFARVLILCLGLFAANCGKECLSSGMCSRGEHCDLNSGECVSGCTRDQDCSANTTCDTMFGNCVPKMIHPPRDARTSTTSSDAASDPLDASTAAD